jgi:hypothetical protein
MTVAGYHGAPTLTAANSVLIALVPGTTDAGAYEFRGSSADLTPPAITATTPAGIASGSSVSPGPTQITLTLSEALNTIDAAAAGNYQLVGAGPDNAFGGADDVVYALAPRYVAGSTVVTLNVTSGPLAVGKYRLSAFGSAFSSLHDLSGLSLDGNADGAAGGDYVRTFDVGATAPTLTAISIGDGTDQRSQVKTLTLTFDRPVTLAAGAASLVRLNSGGSGANDGSLPTPATSALAAPTTPDGGVTWIYTIATGSPFTQTSGGGGTSTGSLVDGIYTLGVDPTKVTAGGVAMSAAPASLTFHRLFGDTDGNKSVNNLDFTGFRNTFLRSAGDGGYNPTLDFDNSGTVNNADFGQFRNRFLKVFAY